MKKKKLKKKIKKLERKIQWLNDCERTLSLRCDKLYHNDVEIKNEIFKLKDGKYYKDDIKDLNNRIDGVFMDTNHLMEQGGQDIPCMGCTADDKKMWKSKEA